MPVVVLPKPWLWIFCLSLLWLSASQEHSPFVELAKLLGLLGLLAAARVWPTPVALGDPL